MYVPGPCRGVGIPSLFPLPPPFTFGVCYGLGGCVVGAQVEMLSGGELQRFAIGIVAVQDADVYMFDEPSSYLDVKQRLKVWDGVMQRRRLVPEGLPPRAP